MPGRAGILTLLATLTALVAGGEAGCGGKSTAAARSGTAVMADTLAAIYARSLADPMSNRFLNRARADSIQASLARKSGVEAMNLRYRLALERLQAGQTREAIAGFESLIRAMGVPPDSIPERHKPLFDLLALSYLRLGEQENCVANPSATRCILPFDPTAVHTREEGAREAIRRYEAILRRFPQDHGSRWLLNIAYMAVGEYPERVPRRFLIPGLSRRTNAAFPRFPNVAGEVGLAVDGLAGGLNVDDFNRDGWLDLFMTSWGLADPVRLFLADGKGGYLDRTTAAGLDGIVGGLNTVHADYDNDGYPDILVLRGAWMGAAGAHPNSLLRNRGDGTFEDVTAAAGLLSFHPTQTAAWADFNLDGWLDLFIGNESNPEEGGGLHRSELYVNNRDGTFTEISRQVGINLEEYVKSVVWGDVNNDGLPDLFASVLHGNNRLYLNRGGSPSAAWHFEEAGAAAGVQMPLASFPSWFWDYDQDGWEDLLVLSYDLRHSQSLHEAVAREYLGLPRAIAYRNATVPVEQSRLYRNRGDGTFADVTREARLDGKVFYPMGSNFGDLDNDGWLDFYLGTGNPDMRSVIPNRMFRGVEGRRFEEVTLDGGFGHLQKGHATAFVDLDRDGDEDVYMVVGGAFEGERFENALFENPGWPRHAWISLALEGRTANRSAIGARVEVVTAEADGTRRTLRRTVRTGGSFGAGSLELHIGLGRAARVDEVRVVWPDSARSRTAYTGVEVNRSYRIVQGERPVALDRPATPFRKTAREGSAGHVHPDSAKP
ncbi:MAG TPA: CRTAC1 family protein [Gemmatimonadales bacterium]|nr:CRTAC1 family protein [Gemmatimonadales bacterium]